MTLADPYLAKASELREIFDVDAVARDKAGGRPLEQIRLLKARGHHLPLNAVLFNVFINSAEGALAEGCDYTNDHSRPRIYSGVEKHTDDPWIQREYGELHIRTLAAVELADIAARALDDAFNQGEALTPEQRGETAIKLATANIYADEIGLDASSAVFEVMGARSATKANGFDRFWRNVRTHTLHNLAEYKKRTIGTWFLDGEYPIPAIYR